MERDERKGELTGDGTQNKGIQTDLEHLETECWLGFGQRLYFKSR